MQRVAILVDGDFFLRSFRRAMDPERKLPVAELAKLMWRYWMRHVDRKRGEILHRIFFYDCPPLTKKFHHPTSGKLIDFSKTEVALFRSALHRELVRQPYVANRMGFLDEKNARWTVFDAKKHKDLIKGVISITDLEADDLFLHAPQKGVDMKIGLDIATLVLKKQAQKIVLISGDSDFVPAAKLARAEGAHFILDAMQQQIRDDLSDHIDSLRSHIRLFSEHYRQQDKSGWSDIESEYDSVTENANNQ